MTGMARRVSTWDTVPMAAAGAAAHHGVTLEEGAPTVGRWDDQSGATAVEYGLIVGAVGIAFIAAGPMAGLTS